MHGEELMPADRQFLVQTLSCLPKNVLVACHMTLGLRVLAALPEDPDGFPRTHIYSGSQQRTLGTQVVHAGKTHPTIHTKDLEVARWLSV